MDLVTRCGFDGSVPEQMTFDYYVYPTVRVAGIAITPQISKTMSVPCPLTVSFIDSLVCVYKVYLLIRFVGA